ncbi:hypothetical protein MFRU_002g02440 [Monilinia fructicola]|uniref:Nitronate monooxygenase domain-containing protein n=1 Tax=Monilinia fructicola TaxID=38448 RepID=A0A5M9K586_MONFR|nr:hypothetical protein EYC84_004389 [Monilinia fructicola]KAG4034895.1 hypothetical protein MFRU_002g02440 [Monilinia fructicola]
MSPFNHKQTLRKDYPWTTYPLISSAPMRLISKPALALAVSRAGGLGFLAAGTDLSTLSDEIREIQDALSDEPIPGSYRDTLPIGIGFIVWGCDLEHVLSILAPLPLPPSAVWLFAPHTSSDLQEWTDSIRKLTGNLTKIWIQVGTVASALSAAHSCDPDVLVIQGSDAGGHGLAHSSSIVSLLPECASALRSNAYSHIPLIAAGGIVESRGAAASFMLGASGICMGTRFLASSEAVIPTGYRNAVLAAEDGGISTTRTTLYDKLRGTAGWPEEYNGRAVVNKSWWDETNGMSMEKNKELYEAEAQKGDEGWGSKGRLCTYAGSGVGLVRETMDAGSIVKEVRDGLRKLIREGGSRL